MTDFEDIKKRAEATINRFFTDLDALVERTREPTVEPTQAAPETVEPPSESPVHLVVLSDKRTLSIRADKVTWNPGQVVFIKGDVEVAHFERQRVLGVVNKTAAMRS